MKRKEDRSLSIKITRVLSDNEIKIDFLSQNLRLPKENSPKST